MAWSLVRGLARIVHAWAWTVFWLVLLGRLTKAVPMDVSSAAMFAVFFTPLVWLSLAVLRSRAKDYGEDGGLPGFDFLLANAWPFVALMSMSFLLLALFNGLSRFGRSGPGLSAVIVETVLLHVLGAVSMALGERWIQNKLVGEDE